VPFDKHLGHPDFGENLRILSVIDPSHRTFAWPGGALWEARKMRECGLARKKRASSQGPRRFLEPSSRPDESISVRVVRSPPDRKDVNPFSTTEPAYLGAREDDEDAGTRGS
jgi:hypothetical protein